MGDARPPGASDTAMQRRGLVASETGGIVAIAVLDSLALAGTSTGDIVVWDMDTNTVKTTLTGHTEKIADIVVEPAGQRAVSASYDGTARVWCLLEFTCLHVLEGHESWLRSVDVYDGLVLTAGGDNTARVWSIDRGVHENTLLGHTDWVKAVRVHRPDRSVTVTGSWDATVRTWSTDTGSLLKTVTCDSAVRCLCDNSKKLEAVAGCVSGSVSIIDLSVGVIRVQLLPPQHDPTNAVRSHMHAILAATSAATVHVWTCDGPSIGVFKQHTAFVNDVSVAPDGTCVSVDGEGHVFAWEMETRRVLFEDATEAPALCCTATGNDETTCLACGLENGRVLSVRFASRDVDTEKPADTTTSRIAGVFGDWFHKKGGWKKTMGLQLTGRKRRFCLLDGASIRYYESLDDQQHPRNLKGTITLTPQTNVETKDLRLLIHTPERTWDLEAAETEQTARWQARLLQVISTLRHRHTHTRTGGGDGDGGEGGDGTNEVTTDDSSGVGNDDNGGGEDGKASDANGDGNGDGDAAVSAHAESTKDQSDGGSEDNKQ